MDRAKMTSEIIEQMNREREDAARREMRLCFDGIIAQQKVIKTANDCIAKHKESLAAISFESVNAADLVA